MEWGASLYFEPEIDLPDDADMETMGSAEEDLHRLAVEAEVTPLDDFFSADRDDWREAVPEDEIPADVSETPTWYPASAGLDTVRALLRAIEARQRAVAEDLDGDPLPPFQSHIDAEGVVAGLRAWERLLARADESGARFRYQSFEL
jgi:hypothetical protein